MVLDHDTLSGLPAKTKLQDHYPHEIGTVECVPIWDEPKIWLASGNHC
jgi:hypothetical protein